MLLPKIAPSSTGDSMHEQRRLTLLAEAGYSREDRTILDEELAPLNQQMDEKRRQARAAHEAWSSGSGTAPETASRLRAALADLETPVVASFARLERQLSADGVMKLRQQITRMKSNTRVLISD
jgi:hypothetical protein